MPALLVILGRHMPTPPQSQTAAALYLSLEGLSAAAPPLHSPEFYPNKQTSSVFLSLGPFAALH